MRALKAWEEAWNLAKDDRSVYGRGVAGIAAGGALDMLATLGYLSGLEQWMDRTKEHGLSGPAGAKAARAREALALIRSHPASIVPSGPKALEILLDWRSGSRADRRAPRPTPPAVLKDGSVPDLFTATYSGQRARPCNRRRLV